MGISSEQPMNFCEGKVENWILSLCELKNICFTLQSIIHRKWSSGAHYTACSLSPSIHL
jgi:hypothetical protein